MPILKITPDGKITIVVARSEMGQGVRTSLPMILAEELEADWKQITIEQAGADPSLWRPAQPAAAPAYERPGIPLRKAGATAREMLISAAALEWGVPRSGCKARKTVQWFTLRPIVVSRTDSWRRRAATMPIPDVPPLKQAKDYQIVGKPVARFDTPSKVDGTRGLWHRFSRSWHEVRRIWPAAR